MLPLLAKTAVAEAFSKIVANRYARAMLIGILAVIALKAAHWIGTMQGRIEGRSRCEAAYATSSLKAAETARQSERRIDARRPHRDASVDIILKYLDSHAVDRSH